MIEKIIIPEIHPSISVWKSWHWSKYNKEKKRWAEMIGWLCKGKHKFKGLVEVEIISYFNTKRRHDYDNYTPKFIMDPLVASGIIKDDCSDIIVDMRTKFRYDKNNLRTEVIITEA